MQLPSNCSRYLWVRHSDHAGERSFLPRYKRPTVPFLLLHACDNKTYLYTLSYNVSSKIIIVDTSS